MSKRLLIEAHAQGNTSETIAYLKFLQTQFPGQRLLILWDGASYHIRSEPAISIAYITLEGKSSEAQSLD